jgi:hypothetical protein
MMPVIRISDATWERLKSNARPLEDSVDDVVCRALDALDKARGVEPRAASVAKPARKRRHGNKLPQKEFRQPLLSLLLELGGEASVATIQEKLEPRIAPRLSDEDYDLVTSGQVRWWNAVCWERAVLVREGLLSDVSPRGIWKLTAEGMHAVG